MVGQQPLRVESLLMWRERCEQGRDDDNPQLRLRGESFQGAQHNREWARAALVEDVDVACEGHGQSFLQRPLTRCGQRS